MEFYEFIVELSGDISDDFLFDEDYEQGVHFLQSIVKSVNSSTWPEALRTSKSVIVGVFISKQLSFSR